MCFWERKTAKVSTFPAVFLTNRIRKVSYRMFSATAFCLTAISAFYLEHMEAPNCFFPFVEYLPWRPFALWATSGVWWAAVTLTEPKVPNNQSMYRCGSKKIYNFLRFTNVRRAGRKTGMKCCYMILQYLAYFRYVGYRIDLCAQQNHDCWRSLQCHWLCQHVWLLYRVCELSRIAVLQ